jgi:peptidoglycan pentaglycine glycine transferase (the first glycine)
VTIRIIRVTERQSDDYDRFVKRLPNGHFRQGYAWGTVMGYEGDVFRLAVERSGSFVGALSIQRKKLPGTPFSFLYAPRGPMADYDDDETIALLFEEARRIASDHMAIFLRIDPDAPDDDHSVRMQLQRHGFRYLRGKDWSSLNYPRLLMRIDTRPDEQELLKGMRKKHRQHINTLARKELVIEEIREAPKLDTFYDLMTDLSVRKGFPLRPFEYYLRLWEAFGDDLRVLMASHSGKYIGGVLSLIHGNKCWYMHGASIAGKGSLHPA